MWDKLKALLESKMISIITVAVLAIVGCASVLYLGPNNAIEKDAEEVIEYELHLPPNTVKLDTSDYQAPPPI